MPFAPAAAVPVIAGSAGSLTLGSTAAAVTAGHAALAIAPSIFSFANIVTGLSSVVGALGNIQAGQAGAAQAAFQARVLHQQAAFARQRSARQEAVFRRNIKRFRGSQRALLAKAGVRVEEGSPLLLQVETAAQAELDALTIRAGGDITAARLRQEAILQRMRGQSSRTAGFIGAGKSLLSAASRIAERFES